MLRYQREQLKIQRDWQQQQAKEERERRTSEREARERNGRAAEDRHRTEMRYLWFALGITVLSAIFAALIGAGIIFDGN